MIAYCKLELLKVKTAMNHFAIKHKFWLKANLIMLKELQALRLTPWLYHSINKNNK
jgi:hypothetical protein